MKMNKRYIVKIDEENEQFKILDTDSDVGTEDSDYEWVATAYTKMYAELICNYLNQFVL